MTNLSKDFRVQLQEVASVTDTKIKVKQVSSGGIKRFNRNPVVRPSKIFFEQFLTLLQLIDSQ